MGNQSGRIIGLAGIMAALALVLMLLAVSRVAAARDQNQELLDAARKGSLDAVKALLQSGADINTKDKEGRTILEIARREDRKEIVQLLRSRGAETAETLRIAKFADNVVRRGADLFLRFKDGRIMSRQSPPEEEETDGYYDLTGYPNVRFTYEDIVDSWYIIQEQYYESYATEFINRETGASKTVYGTSVFSPDRTRFLAIGYPGESPCDAEIWHLSPNGIIREWVLKRLCFHRFEWADQSTVEIFEDDKTVLARIKLKEGSWRCVDVFDSSARQDLSAGLKRSQEGICESLHDSTPLMNAVESGNLDEARRLLAEGANVNAKDRDQETALIVAARANAAEIVTLLLNKGADVNAKDGFGRTALMLAAKGGHREVIELLRDRGAEVTLAAAGAIGDVEAVRQLISQGADVNASAHQGWQPLYWASIYKKWDAVKLLLENGAEPYMTSFCSTALMKVAGDGYTGLVQLLLKGLDVSGGNGWLALNAAAGANRPEIVELLLTKGADINSKDKHGRTVLMAAAIRKHVNMVKLLLEKGSQVDAQDEDGRTALMDAAWGGDAEVVKMLLDKGADVNAKSHRKETALKMAQLTGNREIEKALTERGAKQ